MFSSLRKCSPMVQNTFRQFHTRLTTLRCFSLWGLRELRVGSSLSRAPFAADGMKAYDVIIRAPAHRGITRLVGRVIR